MSILVVMGVVVGMCGWVLTQRVEKVSGVMGVGGGRDVHSTSAELCTAMCRVVVRMPVLRLRLTRNSAQKGHLVCNQRGVSLSDFIAKSYSTVVECEYEAMSKSYGKKLSFYAQLRGA